MTKQNAYDFVLPTALFKSKIDTFFESLKGNQQNYF
jgi:hypothetical protein